ncbi:pyridoxamine 5'-phosphate oxidase family protein [Agrococcus sp. Marseille-Q4369]|uniref:pyridoxamine 5'-phosphate oxidase family protein n=1 Tax=Agrococcus sp. Marseille-Q4369 TaxID=2810513 RepID=UPI001B8BD24B|nr:pyridoxamine 5'-phosphate oxidase family protein [Agrococcus sp. Marseille-Q4369]QUW17743.1 pyridoxamine 5'-phosphate oxidase family protein [Agrococcus sp. Marseille-Q4369]
MSTAGMIEISEDECLKLLRAFEFGRIAFRVGDMLEVFPINYHADGRDVTFRTAPGTKLAGVLLADDVVFEIDHIGEREAWSVVAHGRARRLDSGKELEEAEQLPIRSLVPSVKREFVRIEISRVSGRRFHRGRQPDPAGEPLVDSTD